MSDTGVTLNNLKEENRFILPKNEERNGIPIDTLVRLTFVRNTSEYYLGWLREVTGDGSFLIESIDNGNLCNWSNVSLAYMPIRSIKDQWRWDDRQFNIKDKWFRACYKRARLLFIQPQTSTSRF